MWIKNSRTNKKLQVDNIFDNDGERRRNNKESGKERDRDWLTDRQKKHRNPLREQKRYIKTEWTRNTKERSKINKNTDSDRKRNIDIYIYWERKYGARPNTLARVNKIIKRSQLQGLTHSSSTITVTWPFFFFRKLLLKNMISKSNYKA